MAIKKYNSYKEVESKYKWDLEDILKGKTYEKLEQEYFALFDKIIAVKDSKYNSLKDYAASIKLDEEMLVLGNRISNYLTNWLCINVVDEKYNVLLTTFENKNAEYAKRLGSETNRIAKNREKIEKWLNEPELKDVKKDLEAILDNLNHKLSDDVETYLNDTAIGNPSPEEIFGVITDSEIDFGYATSSKGMKYKITNGTRRQLAKHKDEKVRKETYLNYFGGYYKHRQSLSKTLYQHIKELSVNALYRKYPSTLDSILSADHVDKKLLQVIYSSVQKNINIFRKFYKAHKAFFEKKFNKKMQKWDAAMNLVNIKDHFEVEEGQKILEEITKIMSYDYHQVVQKAIKENWVDYHNVPGKRSGAYSIGGAYGLDKIYILMNWDYTLESVNTLCHEMGHSMHSYYSSKNQNPLRSQYPIFLAEIASIFNELLLSDYLFKNAKTDKEKFFILEKSIDDFIGTVLRQTQWSNYEYELYEAIDKNEPYNNYEALERLYVDVTKKYAFDPAKVKVGDLSNVAAIYVPHYYYHFYVYKYALGYIVANAFFQKYKEQGDQALKDYVDKFLSAGDIDWPAKILLNAGIDIYSESIYDQAFKLLEEKVNKYTELGKKIFK
ncbi:oligoendopeptidase F [[Mycoplasma] falconis]|uniref:Oligopeptidase F n=1 Tax=[Mycoplasma] falconis TaxID=92403 RepID=A0A501XBJ9_9BACT|nr:oligoendopeptidase F [[Mycoplasma] falconis]TPE57733.1 oligoendopeptidase F [[Mycoplasma] falconis]